MIHSQISNEQFAICAWASEAVIVMGSITLLIWVILIPKSPVSTITNVYIPVLPSLEGWNSTGSHRNESAQVSGGWSSTSSRQNESDESVPAPPSYKNEPVWNNSVVFNLVMSNPNEGMGIYYNDIKFTLHNNRNASLGMQYLPAFYQGHKKTATFQVLVYVNRQLWRRIAERKEVLRVGLKTSVKYKIFRLKTKLQTIDFEASVLIKSDGSIPGGEHIDLHLVKVKKTGM